MFAHVRAIVPDTSYGVSGTCGQSGSPLEISCVPDTATL